MFTFSYIGIDTLKLNQFYFKKLITDVILF